MFESARKSKNTAKFVTNFKTAKGTKSFKSGTIDKSGSIDNSG